MTIKIFRSQILIHSLLWLLLIIATPYASADWTTINNLIAEQQYSAAHKAIEQRLEQAKTSKNIPEWTRALIESSKLYNEEGDFKNSIAVLNNKASWPPAQKSQVILSLYYAHAISRYINRYSWKINSRELIKSQEAIPLEKMTMAQLLNKANQAYLIAWQGQALWANEAPQNYKYYFRTSTYPQSIRGSFRDTLTYLWVDFLGDEQHWNPAHANQTAGLNINTLLSVSGTHEASFADLHTHPLLRISALLNNLEQWHQQNKRPEATLEASRIHISELYKHFSSASKQQTLRQALQTQINSHKSLAWSTMLQWSLAKLKQSQGEVDSLIQAKTVLDNCVAVHPGSEGHKRCKNLLEEIKYPSFSMEAMISDGQQKRSIQLIHKNIDRLYFRAWKMSLDNFIKWKATASARPKSLLKQFLGRNKVDASWQTDLPATSDYHSHKTFVTPPMQEDGVWMIAASDDVNFDEDEAGISSVYLNLSGLVADVKTLKDSIEVTAYGGENGRLIPGAEVELFDAKHTLITTAITDQRGKATLGVKTSSRYSVILRHKAESTLADNFYASPATHHSPQENGLIFTDRSIYRPGQTIQWKIIAYQGDRDKGNFRVMPNSKGWIKLLDAHGAEIAKQEVQTNSYGSIAGTFNIKTGANLGSWHIESSWTDYSSNHYVKVEEYKRPTYTVTFNDSTQSMQLNHGAKITGTARYLFGQPVTDGEAKWRITRAQEYRYYTGRYRPSSGSETIASGTAKLDKNGLFIINFVPKPENDAESDVIYNFSIEADVTDSGGETRSTSRSWRIGTTAIKADIELPAAFIDAGKEYPINFKRSDLNDTPRAGQASWMLYQIKQPAAPVLPSDVPLTPKQDELPYATPGDKLSPRWVTSRRNSSDLESTFRSWPDGKLVNKGTLQHDSKGDAAITLSQLPAGLYRLRYTSKDAQGQAFKTQQDFIVASDQPTTIPLPIILKVKESEVEAGKHIEMLVGSGFKQPPVTVDVYQGDKHIRSNVITGGIRKMSIPVTKEYQGGLRIMVSAVKDYQHLSMSQDIRVPFSDRNLDVSFSTFRNKLQPGQKETWRVTVKDVHGRPLQKGMAEIVASMYDKSLDFFTTHSTLSINSLYSQRRTDLGLHHSQGSRNGYTFSRRAEPTNIVSLSGTQLADFSSQLNHTHPPVPGCTDAIRHAHMNGIRNHTHRYNCRGTGAPEEMVLAEYAAMAAPRPRPAPKVVVKTIVYLDAEAITPVKPAPSPVRSNFNETAFFYPNLVLGDNGSVIFEFEVPESLTEWKVWATAITRDLRLGSVSNSVRTSKDLMVRPYLPRFLREGDQAEIEVVINNTSEGDLTGQLDFDIIDPDSKQSRAADFKLTNPKRNFEVKAGESVNLRYAISTPKNPGLIAIRTQATAGKLSDGELRPLAILPSRMHLIESRFAVLNDDKPKTLSFPDLAKADDTTRKNEKLVINVEGQLFYSVLNALPYLVEYPYECTEQTLNRYLSTSIVKAALDQHPAVAAMAKKLATRNTPFEQWDNKDTNRSLLLEETPWLNQAKGGQQSVKKLFNILSAEVANKQREQALKKLGEAQTSSGGFPWWSGGPASPTITLYQLKGFARALEFKSDVPKSMVQAAWGYLYEQYKDKLGKTGYLDEMTMMSYLLTAYPDRSWTGEKFSNQDHAKMMSFAFQNRAKLSQQLKVYLTLALHRSQRKAEAKRVFDSVMDGAITDAQLGTYWKASQRSWLWYNDTTTTHALTLRALTEIAPQDPRRKGMVQWLLMDKKLNHWKSTRATAESIYALVHYLQHEKQPFVQETATIQAGPGLHKELVFKPDEYTGGDQQLVVQDKEMTPDMSNITVTRQGTNTLPMFTSATWHYSTEKLPTQAKGDFLNVTRRFYKRLFKDNKWTLQPLKEGAEIRVGEQLEVQLILKTKHNADYVHLRSPRGAGFEPVTQTSGFNWSSGVGFFEEIRDSGANYFFEQLPAGEVEFRYRLRATTAGEFRVAPAMLQSIYAPEFTAYSSGIKVKISK